MTRLADVAFRTQVGQRLTRVRDELCLSRREFAASLEIAPKTLEKYEQGSREVSAFALARLRQIHGVDVNWVLTGLDKAGASAL